VNTAPHRSLALRAAEEGIVLVKNEADGVQNEASGMKKQTDGVNTKQTDGVNTKRALLPLGSHLRKIAVVGANGGCGTSASDASSFDGGPSDVRALDYAGASDSPASPDSPAAQMSVSAAIAEASSHRASSGPLCAGRVQLLGSYTQYDGTVEVSTVAEALAAETPESHQVRWALGATAEVAAPKVAAARRVEALSLASESDVVVAVLGDDSTSSAEWGDRSSLDLPGDQLALLSALVATGKPLVVVLIGGRTATFGPGNKLLGGVHALLSAFRPGQMGGVAIARLLLGKANPSGKLAQNWARSAGQAMSGATPWLQYRVGKWVANHRSDPDPDGRVYDDYQDEAGSPLFHFGHGLSYTSFNMSALEISKVPSIGKRCSTTPQATPSIAIQLTLTNTGQLFGTEVLQAYAIDPVSDFVRPWKRLLTFSRVSLDAGASTRVRLLACPEDLAFQDDSSPTGTWRVVPGEYLIRVGPSSVEDLLVASVRL